MPAAKKAGAYKPSYAANRLKSQRSQVKGSGTGGSGGKTKRI